MRTLTITTLLLTFTTFIGCGGGIPGLVPASGTVFYDGKPIEGVSIVFTPSDSGSHYSVAVSGSGGTFALNTAGRAGALPGHYIVTLSKTEIRQLVTPEEADRLTKAEKRVPSEVLDLIPWKYSEASKSGIEIRIPFDGVRDIRIDLLPDNSPKPVRAEI